MNLKVHSIENKGKLDEECVWIDVKEEITNLSYYAICDTTYTDDHHISNELRHIYWFANQGAKKNDWIKLMTKSGANTTTTNNRKTTTHIFYWGLGKTVWNKDGDAAVLFQFADWATTRV